MYQILQHIWTHLNAIVQHEDKWQQIDLNEERISKPQGPNLINYLTPINRIRQLASSKGTWKEPWNTTWKHEVRQA